jgi:hypothetical protein
MLKSRGQDNGSQTPQLQASSLAALCQRAKMLAIVVAHAEEDLFICGNQHSFPT